MTLAGERRTFLFLQGMANWFFAELGSALAARGHSVHRVNFNGGDALFWPLGNAVNYRGRTEGWPDFLSRLISAHGITNIVLFGDCRAPHRAAISLAQRLGVCVHVCEEGYLRPNWVTFERDGVNGRSTLPRDPAWYLSAAAALPPLDPMPLTTGSFARRAIEDMMYNGASLALGLCYPHYRTHRPRPRLLEYATWSWKIIRRPAARRRARRQAGRLAATDSYFVLPLQLESDTQIRQYSPFPGIRPVLTAVIASFATHAPGNSLLVVREHPLDDARVIWRKHVIHIAAAEGIAGRVIFQEVGDLNALIGRARGVVTVNSTTGTLAIGMGVPVITLGHAIYDLPGLTFQGGLAAFWTTDERPDERLFHAFRRVLADRCLLPGGFYSTAGLRLLVAHAIARLEATPRTQAIAAAEPSRKTRDPSAVFATT